MSFGSQQASWATALLDGLVDAGVREVVVSPGSRSTPLVIAVARAEAEGRLRATVVVDERAAAFFALGQARVTGSPTLLLCTSGTAGAHYFPALIEAGEARVPIIALTADRPPELRGRGASQTIDQRGMFGRFVRRDFDIGPAEADPRAANWLRRTAALAVHAAMWPDPGPVHINAAFRKPLESRDPPAREGGGARGGAPAPVPTRPACMPADDVLAAVAERVAGCARGLIVLGPASPFEAATGEAVEELARATGYPILAEATSQHRFGATRHKSAIDAFEPLFGSATFVDRAAPQLVLQVGGAPTSRALGSWIARSAVERIVIARHGMPEAYNQAARIVIGDLDPALRGLARLVGSPPADADWTAALAATDDRASSMAADVADSAGSQGGIVRAAVQGLPEGGQLVVGNSMPVRDVDLYVPAAARGIRVLSQRGAAGIDGLIAGAAGTASVSGRPTLLLLGDVSFQHDVGGLAVAATVDAPLVIVVIANGGGRLFDLLPVGTMPEIESTFERFFLTPPSVDVGSACAAFGVRAFTARFVPEFTAALAEGLAEPGATVIEATVNPDGADAVRRITSLLDAWLAGPEGCLPA